MSNVKILSQFTAVRSDHSVMWSIYFMLSAIYFHFVRQMFTNSIQRVPKINTHIFDARNDIHLLFGLVLSFEQAFEILLRRLRLLEKRKSATSSSSSFVPQESLKKEFA